MKIAATAYLQDSDDLNAVQLILTGFTGTLKLWWENFLIEKERFYVSKSLNEEGEQDAVTRLIYATVKHFIGDPNTYQERSSEILQNLKCRTLYVQKASEIERGTPRLVINYKPLNKVL